MKTIYLDATLKSNLKWELPLIDQKVVWRLDLGLEKLLRPLEDPQQCAALKLACDHFVDTLYTKYEKETDSVIFYQGSLETPKERDLLSDYLDILTAHVPKSVVMKLIFEAKKELDPLWNHFLYHLDAFPRFTLIKKNLAQNGGEKTGILLPPPYLPIDKLMQTGKKGRILCESELLYSFAGLDEIVYDPQAVTEEAFRVLAGFKAADGILVEC